MYRKGICASSMPPKGMWCPAPLEDTRQKKRSALGCSPETGSIPGCEGGPVGKSRALCWPVDLRNVMMQAGR